MYTEKLINFIRKKKKLNEIAACFFHKTTRIVCSPYNLITLCAGGIGRAVIVGIIMLSPELSRALYICAFILLLLYHIRGK